MPDSLRIDTVYNALQKQKKGMFMSMWEKKRDEMRRKIARDSKIVLGVLIASATVSVVAVFRLCQLVENNELKKDYLLLQEMRKEVQQRQR